MIKDNQLILNLDDDFDLTWLYNRISKLYLRRKKYGTQYKKIKDISAILDACVSREKIKEYYENKQLEYPLEKL